MEQKISKANFLGILKISLKIFLPSFFSYWFQIFSKCCLHYKKSLFVTIKKTLKVKKLMTKKSSIFFLKKQLIVEEFCNRIVHY